PGPYSKFLKSTIFVTFQLPSASSAPISDLLTPLNRRFSFRQLECSSEQRQEGRSKKGVKAMHFSEDRILEMAQEGKKLSDKEQLHLKKCVSCGELFRIFVLQGFFMQQ